jgi:hypothetical protein
VVWLTQKDFGKKFPDETSGFRVFVEAPKLSDGDDPKFHMDLKRIDGDEKIVHVNAPGTAWLGKHTSFAAARLMGRVYALRGEELPGVLNWNVLKGLIVESVASK